MSWPTSRRRSGSTLCSAGTHDVGEESFGRRHHVDAADAGEVGLDELERFPPHRAREVDERVETAEDRVVGLLTRSPAFAQPALFGIGQAQNLPHLLVGEIQRREPLDRLLHDHRDGVNVGELRWQDGDRAGKDADRVELAVVEIDDVPPARAVAQALDQFRDRRLGQPIERTLHSARQRQAAETLLLGDGQHCRYPAVEAAAVETRTCMLGLSCAPTRPTTS